MRYLLVGLLLLAGCSPTQVPTDSPSAVAPSGVTTTPTPEPTPTCSPIGGTPSPCSPDEYAKVEAQNKLVNEAIAVYKRWLKESNRLHRVGGTLRVTTEMEATTAGEAQRSALAIFGNLRRGGVRAVSGSAKLVTIGPRDVDVEPGQVALQTCVDASSFKFVANGKTVRRGFETTEELLLEPVEGQLKISSVSARVAKSCS